MIPPFTKTVYPEFVADQVLTSDNLNDMFGYLDEQGRMTRTQLVGVGIACGLKIVTATNGTKITITKGVGVTGEGYLVALPETDYTKRGNNIFNAVQCEYYHKFVDTAAGNTKKFDLWELKEEDDTKDTTALTPGFLNEGQKIVLLFVEKLEENNKNCDPNSCDDKGTKVTVTVRPLLAAKADVDAFLSNNSNTVITGNAVLLPEAKMPRYNAAVPALSSAGDVLNAYKAILTPAFINSVQTVLTGAYTKLQPLLKYDFSGNEFEGLITIFNLIRGGAISPARLQHIQYYYDFVADLLLGYEELRTKACELVCDCVPDDTLFPRHLLLGEAVGFDEASSLYRTRFVSSGALCCCAEDTATVKFLFQRLVLMVQRFFLPGVSENVLTQQSLPLKITPSSLGTQPLSKRAIPYYYDANAGTKKLFHFWNQERTLGGTARNILSYGSTEYNIPVNDLVLNPLKYDLEAYNFFRVEGITGKMISSALAAVKSQISDAALPIKTIALATGGPRQGYQNDECCSLTDIELQFRLLKTTLLCCIKNNVRYWASLEKKDDDKGSFILLPPMVMVNVLLPGLLLTVNTPPFLIEATPAVSIATTVTGTNPGTANPAGLSMPASHMEARTAAPGTPVAAGPATMARGKIIKEIFGEYVPASSIAHIYNQYQVHEGIDIRNLPQPAATSPAENISYYILVLIDELEALADVLAAEKVEDFNESNFINHADELKNAHTKLLQLASGYHSKGYLIEKIKLNATAHVAEIDKIAAAMPIISDSDSYSIILVLLNHVNTAAFVSQVEAAKGSYSAQQVVINRAYQSLDKDGMMIPQIKLPPASANSEYNSMVEQLKKGACFCEIDNLKYLIQKYKEQYNKLRDVTNFSVYVQHHPGVQHKAGVTSGGTLVLVYKGINDNSAEGIVANTVIADFYLPYTCCSDCTPLEISIQEAPEPANIPPVAKPGDNVTIELPATTVTLDGRASTDPDGTIKKYLWEQVQGAAAAISDVAVANPVVSGLATGTYKFKLTVTDDDNAINAGIVTITVMEKANIPPTAVASSDKVNITFPENTVTLNGSGSTDTDGRIVSHVWSMTAGATGAAIQEANKANTRVTFSQTGLFVFTLTVTDNRNATDTDKVFVLVNEKPNLPPKAIATVSKNAVTLDNGAAKVVLNGSDSSDPEGLLQSYNWSLRGGTTGATITASSDKTTEVIFSLPGIYLFTLTVTDIKGAYSNDYAVVAVSEKKSAPTESSCGALSAISGGFNAIKDNNDSQFKNFREVYASYTEVSTFYDVMAQRNIAAAEAGQISFFKELKVHPNLINWITKTNPGPFVPEINLSVAALTMLNIHAQLAYYIACIQTKDVNQNAAAVPMEGSLNALIDVLRTIVTVVLNSAQGQKQKDLLIQLRTLTTTAKNVILTRGDDKPIYITKLNDILEKISQMQL